MWTIEYNIKMKYKSISLCNNIGGYCKYNYVYTKENIQHDSIFTEYNKADRSNNLCYLKSI